MLCGICCGVESNAISILYMCSTCSRFDNKADLDFDLTNWGQSSSKPVSVWVEQIRHQSQSFEHVRTSQARWSGCSPVVWSDHRPDCKHMVSTAKREEREGGTQETASERTGSSGNINTRINSSTTWNPFFLPDVFFRTGSCTDSSSERYFFGFIGG